MWSRWMLSTRIRQPSSYLVRHRRMSASAYIIPYDHQSKSAVIPDVDPAQLWSLTPQGEKPPKAGTTRIFYNTPPSKLAILSSLGDGFASKNANQKRELVRQSVGGAVKDLKNLEGLKDVAVDAALDSHAAGTFQRYLQSFCDTFTEADLLDCAAVAAHLSLYKFTLKTSPPSSFNPNLKESLPEKMEFSPLQETEDWNCGVTYARAQNLARTVRFLTKFTCG